LFSGSTNVSFFEMNTFVMMLKKIYTFLIFPYTIFLLYLMFFGFGRTQMEHNIIRVVPIFSTISFVENRFLWNDWKGLITNVFGNIGMFVPFGFLGLIFPEFGNFKRLMFSFLSILVVVESLQYFTRLGVFDVDDIVLNSFGVLIGFLVFRRLPVNTGNI